MYLQRRVRDAGVLIPYEPNSEADLLTDEFRVRYRTNRFGYRDRQDRRAERTPGVARIGLLGDSFAAGWGVEFEETFGDRFERATGIEVVNAAKNGGCALWFVPQARFVRETFAPDWLLVQIFDNDLDDNLIDAVVVRDRGRRALLELPPDAAHRRDAAPSRSPSASTRSCCGAASASSRGACAERSSTARLREAGREAGASGSSRARSRSRRTAWI